MARWLILFAALAAATLPAQEPKPQPSAPEAQLKRERPQPASGSEIEAPPEEDKDMGVHEYSFNPLQAEKEVRVGNYYMKQRNYRAASGRFREATKWNDGNSDAWLHLAEASEKLKDTKTVREAYEKYVKLAPGAKDVPDIRKKLAKLK